MHVCHFCDTSLEGDYFRFLAEGLSRHGIKVSLVELGPGTAPKWLDEVPGIGYTALGVTSKLGFPLASRRLAALLRSSSVDILHTHLFNAGLLGVLTCKMSRGAQSVLMRHHTSVVRMLGSRFHVAADKWMAENADHVVTVSEAARRYMLEEDQIKRPDIEVAHLGFDFERFRPDVAARRQVRAEFGFAESDVVVGYVGAIVPGKGHLQLLQAFRSVITERPNAKLLIVGRGDLAEVAAAFSKLPHGSVVRAGWREDIPGCLNAMDVFVQPSLSEAFSQVLIEAMACALPVIATDVGGASEVIAEGTTGYLVQSDDPPAICSRIKDLCDSSELRRIMGEAARYSVIQRFSMAGMVKRHIELYREWSTNRE